MKQKKGGADSVQRAHGGGRCAGIPEEYGLRRAAYNAPTMERIVKSQGMAVPDERTVIFTVETRWHRVINALVFFKARALIFYSVTVQNKSAPALFG